MRYYPGVSPAIPHTRAGCSRVTHPFAGCSKLPPSPRDLHVLSTPPAFVLSQDQTLQENSTSSPNATFGSIQRSHPESVFVNRSLAAAHETPRLKREPSHDITHSIVK